MPHAVVTGTSSGIGQAIARRLLDHGWHVTGFDRAKPTLDHAAFDAVTLDIVNAKARADALDAADGVTALVHAAGIMRGGKLGELDLAAGETLWRLHVDVAVALADRLAPRLTAGGRLVFIGRPAARRGIPQSPERAREAAPVRLARGLGEGPSPPRIPGDVLGP